MTSHLKKWSKKIVIDLRLQHRIDYVTAWNLAYLVLVTEVAHIILAMITFLRRTLERIHFKQTFEAESTKILDLIILLNTLQYSRLSDI